MNFTFLPFFLYIVKWIMINNHIFLSISILVQFKLLWWNLLTFYTIQLIMKYYFKIIIYISTLNLNRKTFSKIRKFFFASIFSKYQKKILFFFFKKTVIFIYKSVYKLQLQYFTKIQKKKKRISYFIIQNNFNWIFKNKKK